MERDYKTLLNKSRSKQFHNLSKWTQRTMGHTITPAQYHGSGSPRPQQYSLWLLFWSDFQFNFISRWIALGFQFNFEMIFTLIMQLLLLLNLLATSFYFQSFFFLCFAVTFHFTFSFDLFFLLFFIKSLKNCKILSGSPRPPRLNVKL